MCAKGFQLLLVFLTVLSLSLCQDGDVYPRMPISPPPRRPPPELINNIIDGVAGNGFMGSGFMNSARRFVASPAGQMVVTMAKEFISRSGGGGQVLSLNLTSLLIVVLLKGLIFATGLLGAGNSANWGQYGRGRGLENSELN